MVNRNYKSGYGFEIRYLNQLLESKKAIKGARYYASKGICDVWWVDQNGVMHDDQLKYSRIRCPKISTEEFLRLIQYSIEVEGKIKVSLVSKQSRKPVMVWELN